MNTKYLIRGLWLAGLTFGLASCQNDEIETTAVGETTEVNAITLTAVMGGEIESRAVIKLGNEDEDMEYIQWNEGDVLIVQNLGQDGTDTDGVKYKFEITDYSDADPSNSATFVCTEAETNAISEGDVLCAFYLGSDATIDDYTNYLSLPNGVDFTTYTEDEIKEYLKDNLYMVGKTTFSANGTSLTMQQLTSMLRVTYNNATDTEQTLYELHFSGSNSWISTYMYYDVVEGTYNIWWSDEYGYMWFNEGLTVGAYESVDLYYLCFPSYDEFTESEYVYIYIDGEEVWLKTDDIPTTKFDIGKRYWFDITKYDTGLEWTNYELIFDNYITIAQGTNDALCEILEEKIAYSYFDDEGNFYMPTDVVNLTTTLDLTWSGLASLKGIEYFTNLEYLHCYYNYLTSLDLSSLVNLKVLQCSMNELTSLDVSALTNLEELWCSENELTSLDVSALTNLRTLRCYDCNLTELDLTYNTALEYLDCYSNDLSALDVSGLSELYYLDAENNPNIQSINCAGLKLTTLSISGNEALTALYCNNNHLSELDIRDSSNLTELTCGNQTYEWSEESQALTLSLYQSQYDSICDSDWQSDEKNSNVEFDITVDPVEAIGTEDNGTAENFTSGGIF